jgi:hypothetical protein
METRQGRKFPLISRKRRAGVINACARRKNRQRRVRGAREHLGEFFLPRLRRGDRIPPAVLPNGRA